ncbi:hypothetical protein O5558_20580 [Escherichia coli]|nr:hypothetical protein [Escherichia coli]
MASRGGTAVAGNAYSRGLVVSLCCGAINQLLVIFHHDQLAKHVPVEHRNADANRLGRLERLWPQLLGGVMLTLLLLRPLTLMGLDDARRAIWLAFVRWRVWRRCRWRDCHQCAAGECGRDYRLYRVVRAAAGKMLGRGVCCRRLMLASLIGALILWLPIKSSSG